MANCRQSGREMNAINMSCYPTMSGLVERVNALRSHIALLHPVKTQGTGILAM